MWKMKSCPRCNGDMFVDWDEDGMFNHCLQCGYAGNIESSCLVAEGPLVKKHFTTANK